ncbi:hypothetical protein Ciccas_012723, partial [Cichlidogyrus casuarinus]
SNWRFRGPKYSTPATPVLTYPAQERELTPTDQDGTPSEELLTTPETAPEQLQNPTVEIPAAD